MPGNIDDFLQRFSSQQTLDDREAEQHFDRFASDHPDDRHYDNQALYAGASEYLGKLPERDFEQAAQNAYAKASPEQQQGLASSLMRAFQGAGGPGAGGGRSGALGGAAALASLFGGGGVMPSRLSPSQYGQAAGLLRRQHPAGMQDLVREQPWFLKAMGNPVMMGVLGVVASRLIKGGTGPSRSSAPRADGLIGRMMGGL